MHLGIRKAQGMVNLQPATGAFWMAAGLCRSCRGVGIPDGPADSRPPASSSSASVSWFHPVDSTLHISVLSSWESLLAQAPCHGSSDIRLGAMAVLRLTRSWQNEVPKITTQRRFGGSVRNQPRSVRDRSELQLMSLA